MWVMDRVAAEAGSPELLEYVSSIARTAVDSGEPVTSRQFLSGLERELGFVDREGVFAAFVFGGEDTAIATGEGGASALSPIVSTPSSSGFGPVEMSLLLGGLAAALVVVAAARSLRVSPPGSVIATRVPVWDESGIGSVYDGDGASAGSSDSEWPF
jgi:hypothetical protein